MAADIVEDYGAHGDLTAEFSTFGKNGECPQNSQRDFKTWLKTLDGLPTSKIKCTMKRTDAVGTHIIDQEIIWPFDLVGSAYDELSRDKFEQTFMGPQGREGVQEFWEKQESQPWVQKHPGLQPCPSVPGPIDRSECVPFYVHADAGQHINDDKVLVVSWGGSLSRLITKLALFMFTLLPMSLAVPNITETEIYGALVWSMGWLKLGVYPDKHYDGTPFKVGSWRHTVAGKPFAGGLRFLFSEYRGDWEWQLSAFRWRGCHLFDFFF